uniref:DNA_pol_B_exo1 domain-containing protein n=1 Tax=Panagrellus redivivus TaxID=6233 RepID=A0A7E4W6K6_PANRE
MTTLTVRNVHCETTAEFVNGFSSTVFNSSYHKFIRLPVVRIFGITQHDEKCLIHLHGALPYLLLRTRTRFDDDVKTQVGRIVVKCARLLKHPLRQGQPLLHEVVPVEATDFYGFYPEKDHFVKVVFYDARLAHRIGMVLQKESPKSRLLQPYLTHVPYLLQVFIDANLAGMGLIHFQNVHYRRHTAAIVTGAGGKGIVFNGVGPVSNMAVEADVWVHDIVKNGSQATQTDYQCAGLEFIWREEELRRNQLGSQLDRPSRPEWGVPKVPTTTESKHLESLKQMLNKARTGNANMSQLPVTPSRLSAFATQAVIKNAESTDVVAYVDSQSNQNELDDAPDPDDHEYESTQQLEMTQIIQIDDDEEPPLIDLCDSPDIEDLCDDGRLTHSLIKK